MYRNKLQPDLSGDLHVTCMMGFSPQLLPGCKQKELSLCHKPGFSNPDDVSL